MSFRERLVYCQFSDMKKLIQYNPDLVNILFSNSGLFTKSTVSNHRTASEWKTRFHMPCKEGQFDVVELMVNDQFKTFGINLNAQHVNGMTPFDLAVHMYSY